jgi:hypothetical protein
MEFIGVAVVPAEERRIPKQLKDQQYPCALSVCQEIYQDCQSERQYLSQMGVARKDWDHS